MAKTYRKWKVLKTHTGLGYNLQTKTINYSNEVWESFLEKYGYEEHEFRYECLWFEDLYLSIFDSHVPTSEYMTRSGTTFDLNGDVSQDDGSGYDEDVGFDTYAHQPSSSRNQE